MAVNTVLVNGIFVTTVVVDCFYVTTVVVDGHYVTTAMGQFDAWPRWVNLSPAFLRNGLSVLTAKVPVEWKSNFQNELTNQKFDTN